MVGKDHVVVGVNTSFQVFDKNGNSLVGPTLYEDFWGSNCATGSSNVVMFDPYSAYDEENGRYVLGSRPMIRPLTAATTAGPVSPSRKPTARPDHGTSIPLTAILAAAPIISSTIPISALVRMRFMWAPICLATSSCVTISLPLKKMSCMLAVSANFAKINVGSSNFTMQPAKLKGLFNRWLADKRQRTPLLCRCSIWQQSKQPDSLAVLRSLGVPIAHPGRNGHCEYLQPAD